MIRGAARRGAGRSRAASSLALGVIVVLAAACAPATVAAAGAPTPPVNTGAPSISDTTPHDADALTAYPGGWTGTLPITFAYQWQRCDATGLDCADLPGATAKTLAVDAGLVGAPLRVRVVATNVAGSVVAVSATTAAVGPTKPANVVLPVTSGAAVYGSTVSASDGVWTGTAPITFAYRWKRCDATGTTCTSITGATSPTYTVTLADAGSTLRFAVTASNAAGSTAATGAASPLVPLVAPINTNVPTVSDTTPHDGDRLTGYSGSWIGSPTITFGYQWRRCDGGGSGCVDIAGATASTYVVTPADAATTIVVAVTATNGAGSTTVGSAPTSLVDSAAPVKANPLPTITGTAAVGSTLVGTSGAWSGSAPITYAYRWKRCDAAGGSCKSINGATDPTYVVDLADVGFTIRLSVTASNPGGSAAAASGPTALIAPVTAINQVPPTISDTTPHDLDVLTAYPGSWWGTQPVVFTYEWQRCDTVGTSCTAIAGATAATYVVGAADLGSTIRVVVTATNAAGVALAASTPTAVVDPAAPVAVALPTITGTAADGGLLAATPGSWTGTVPMTFGYRWLRCNATGGGCLTVVGRTDVTYAVTAADVNSTIRVAVTAVNGGGTASATAAPSSVVTGFLPTATDPPVVSGTAAVGLALTSTVGGWSGSGPIATVAQWLRCDALGAACSAVAGATTTTFSLTASDEGHTVRARVTATGPAGSTTNVSAPTAVVGGVPVPTFLDAFAIADGLVTNEYAFYNPTHSDAITSPDWEMTSGSLFARNGHAWSGAVDDRTPDAGSTNGTDSAIFRLRSVRADYANVGVSVSLRIDALGSTSRTPETAFDGVHVWVRYTSETSLYAISVARRDGTVRIKKKCPGGPSNGGVYYDLTPSLIRPLALDQWADFTVVAVNGLDGSVTLDVYRDGALLRRVTDTGVGCAPITDSGRIGVRGDNAEFELDDVTVRNY